MKMKIKKRILWSQLQKQIPRRYRKYHPTGNVILKTCDFFFVLNLLQLFSFCRFLFRGDPNKSETEKDKKKQKQPRIRGHTRSGRVIKGRGTFRYRTPSRSRSRSYTPPHWKRELSRTIKLSEYEVTSVIWLFMSIHIRK